MFDFSLSSELAALKERTAAFIHDEVIPREPSVAEHDGLPADQLETLRQMARAAGLYAPHVEREWGGLGLSMREMSVIFEEAGRSMIGPLALNCAAPDEGNMHLLELVASPAQKERYLRPLVEGRIRSCFAMTEPPPGAGADPNLLRTRATRRMAARMGHLRREVVHHRRGWRRLHHLHGADERAGRGTATRHHVLGGY